VNVTTAFMVARPACKAFDHKMLENVLQYMWPRLTASALTPYL
jgi:hypothetical protein